MTSRQRLMAATNRSQPDRAPVHVHGVCIWDEDWVSSRDASYAPVIQAALEHGDLVAE